MISCLCTGGVVGCLMYSWSGKLSVYWWSGKLSVYCWSGKLSNVLLEW